MADIRINSLPTTAVASSSDDFLALDGTTNGTRKLNAYSPTFGGNLTVNGTASAGTLTDGYITITAAEIKRLSNFVEIQGSGSGGVRMFGATATPITFSSAGNLTVSGKIIGGNSSDSGAISTLRSSGAATGLANVKASSALTVVDNTTANTDSAMVFGVNGSGAYIQGLYTTVASTITLQPYGGATTLGGNLTVSGTGNNTFNSGGGNLGIGITPTLAKLEVRTATATTGAKTNIAFLGSSNAGGLLISHSNAGSRFHTDLTSTIFGSSGNDLDLNVNDGVGGMTIKYQGNVLIGTTTDSSNGKLQLATHTTSAGGIGFGTDYSLYRIDNQTMALNASGLYSSTLGLYLNGSLKGSIGVDTAAVYIGGRAAGYSTIILSGNSTTALTLDASQNATFAGTISQTQAAAGSTANLKLAELGIREWGFYATGGKMSIRPSSIGTWSFNGNTDVELLRTTASTSTTTGALVVSGGVGVAGVVNTGDVIVTQGGTASTPANAFATGTAGTIRWDASYIYVCTAANTWKRVAIAAW